ncbi:hypothetical protein [Pseudomonas sp. Marseille-QA0892]
MSASDSCTAGINHGARTVITAFPNALTDALPVDIEQAHLLDVAAVLQRAPSGTSSDVVNS